MTYSDDVPPPFQVPPGRHWLYESFLTPRQWYCGGCICLTHQERRRMRRVFKFARVWTKQRPKLAAAATPPPASPAPEFPPIATPS